MEKIYGTNQRQDGLVKVGRRWVLFFGFFKDSEDAESAYEYRKNYDTKPTLEQVKADIIDQVNADTDRRILEGFVWNGHNVWLSTENQFNFKAAYDMAVQTGGSSLPVTFKLGEKEDGTPDYFEFADLESFGSFIASALAYVQKCLTDGWTVKDNVDWGVFGV